MHLEGTLPASAKAFAGAVSAVRAGSVVIDTYRQKRLLLAAAKGKPTLVFDDHYKPPMGSSIVVNASPSATRDRYKIPSKLLLGPGYASLHSAFSRSRRRFQVRAKIQRILVALGGNDTAGKLPAVVRAVRKLFPSAELSVCGAPAANIPDHPLIVRNAWLSQQDMANLMGSCDLGVLAGGQMLVQAACIGLPALALPQTPNQALHAASWETIGSVVVAQTPARLTSAAGTLSLAVRRRMSEAGRNVVDGKGAGRIAKQLLQLTDGFC